MLVGAVAGACSSSSGAGPAASTIAPDSPWVGAFTTVVLPAPVNSLQAVDCPTQIACWAVGSTVGRAGVPNGAAVLATTNGGATWTPQVIPPTTGHLSAVSCSDQRQCVAVGQAALASNGSALILATADGGRSWQSRPVPPGFLDLTAVTCRSDRRCVAVGDVAGGAATLTSASAQGTWVERGTLPAGVAGATGVSCPDDTHCWVTARRAPDPDHVAGVVVVTANGGSSWTPLATPGHIGYLNGISCPSSGSGSGSANGSLPFTGTTSAPAAPGPGATSPTTAARVPPARNPTPPGLAGAHCVAVGTTSDTLTAARTGHGVVLTTDNGGLHWVSRPVPATTASVAGVSCTADDSCVMVGSSVSTSARAGSIVLTGPARNPWGKTAEVDAPQPLTGVSCTAQSRCLAVGEAISEHLVGG